MRESANRYGASHLSGVRARSYDDELAKGYQGALWNNQERPRLSKILRELRGLGASSSLDIACGTGRILAIEAEAGFETFGVDISPAMAAVCRVNNPTARVVVCDVSLFHPRRTFDVVTAFRFFTNADRRLRIEAVDAAARLLPIGGTFISTTHLQVTSPGGLARWVARVARGRPYPRAYSEQLHVRLLRKHGFHVERVERYGLMPNLGHRIPECIARLLVGVDRLEHLRRMRWLHDSAMVVARRVR